MAAITQVGATHLSFWSGIRRRRCFEPPLWSLGYPQTVHDLSPTVARRRPDGRQTVIRLSPDGRRTVTTLCELPSGIPLGCHWGRPLAAPWQPLGSPLAAPWQLYGSPNSSNGSQNSSNGAQNVSNGTHEPVQRGAQTRPMAHANSSNGAHKLVQCSVATHGVAPRTQLKIATPQRRAKSCTK